MSINLATRNGTRTKTVLVVDDQPIARAGLRALISEQRDLDVCGEAGGLAEAMRTFLSQRPELIITELTLNDGCGLDLVREIVSQDPQAKVLVQSIQPESLYAERALRVGAMGYLHKAEETTVVLGAIRRVLEGRVYLSLQMTNRLLQRSVGRQLNTAELSPLELLTDRELEVFKHIGHGVTTRQIAERLYLSPKTIETYREHIKAKLKLNNAAELTQHAVKWVLEQHN